MAGGRSERGAGSRAVGGRTTASRELYRRIYAMVDSIPPGRVATYGQIAREAGAPRHARAVGYALRNLPPKSPLPWHRVLNAQGRVSPRPGEAPRLQLRRLRAEGVRVGRDGRVDLDEFGWKPGW